jgi:hypothetical protein
MASAPGPVVATPPAVVALLGPSLPEALALSEALALLEAEVLALSEPLALLVVEVLALSEALALLEVEVLAVSDVLALSDALLPDDGSGQLELATADPSAGLLEPAAPDGVASASVTRPAKNSAVIRPIVRMVALLMVKPLPDVTSWWPSARTWPGRDGGIEGARRQRR